MFQTVKQKQKKTGITAALMLLMQYQPGSGSAELGVAGTLHYKVLHLLQLVSLGTGSFWLSVSPTSLGFVPAATCSETNMW